MLSVIYAECRFAECRYADCNYAERRIDIYTLVISLGV
jgi:hypothetical protein